MSDKNVPESGTRTRIKTDQGEEIAIWTGFMWASEDGSRIIDPADIQSWEEAPHEDELTITREDEEG